MRLPVVTLLPGLGQIVPNVRIDVEPRKTGVALILIGEAGALGTAITIATVMLRWVELGIGTSLFVAAEVAFVYRSRIADSWLIHTWAMQHNFGAAFAVSALVVVLGLVAAAWKRRELVTYSLGELVVGALASFNTAFTLFAAASVALSKNATLTGLDLSGKLLALASALYIVSRGAGNLTDAFIREARGFARVTIGSAPAPPQRPSRRLRSHWPPL